MKNCDFDKVQFQVSSSGLKKKNRVGLLVLKKKRIIAFNCKQKASCNIYEDRTLQTDEASPLWSDQEGL